MLPNVNQYKKTPAATTFRHVSSFSEPWPSQLLRPAMLFPEGNARCQEVWSVYFSGLSGMSETVRTPRQNVVGEGRQMVLYPYLLCGVNDIITLTLTRRRVRFRKVQDP